MYVRVLSVDETQLCQLKISPFNAISNNFIVQKTLTLTDVVTKHTTPATP